MKLDTSKPIASVNYNGVEMELGGKSPFPAFTYTGRYGLLDDGDGNWRIKFLSSGVFTPEKDMEIDVFLVGGGGGGACTAKQYYGGGGAGGYTATHKSVQLYGGTAYTVIIGAGGAPRVDGGTAENGCTGGSTSFDNLTVAGGTGGLCYPYSPSLTGSLAASLPNGGCGGAGYMGVGGSDGGNGGGTNGGTGQGTTTREFGESSGDLYAGGGGCGSGSSSSSVGYAGGAGGGGMGASYSTKSSAMSGEANTGGGGGGGAYVAYVGGYGGCGVVVIRNVRIS